MTTRQELATQLGKTEEELTSLESKASTDTLLGEQTLLSQSGLTIADLAEILEEQSYRDHEQYASHMTNLVAYVTKLKEDFDVEIRILTQHINRLSSEIGTTDHQLRQEMQRRLSAAVPLDK